MMLASVLFDLDGTLIDTAPDFVTVLNLLLSEKGQPSLSYQTIRTTVSNGARALITLGFGIEESHTDFAALRARLLELYAERLSENSCLFPQMDSVLTILEQNAIPWGIVTNKPRLYAEPLLINLDLDKRCSVLVCPDDVQHTKPNPEPIYLACDTLKVSPEHSLYLGDHARDIESGRNAGCKTVACQWGYISDPNEIQAWQADYTLKNATDLLPLLNLS